MGEQNRTAMPEPVAAAARQFTEELASIYGDDLLSVVAYGSALTEDYEPRRSNVNLLVVLADVNAPQLAKAAGVQARYLKSRNFEAVFVEPAYLTGAADAFPLEFLDMQESHLRLHGDDPLEALQVGEEHLRLQVERELREKLMRLRQAYLRDAGDARALSELAGNSFGSFVHLLRALVRLQGETPAIPKAEAVAQAASVVGLDPDLLNRLERLRAGADALDREEADEFFDRYLSLAESLCAKANETRVAASAQRESEED